MHILGLVESKDLQTLANNLASPHIRTEVLATISHKDGDLPIVGVTIGRNDPTLPTLVLMGGVHGLERIGAQVVIAFLNYLRTSLEWDQNLRALFEHVRLVSIPVVNPHGILNHRRCNPNGVDLMRNAPIDAVEKETSFLLSGHRYSSALPWYRGQPGVLELENRTIVDFFQREVFASRYAVSIDVHSGFGLRDQIWYPWGYSQKEVFQYQKQFDDLFALYKRTHPYHVYKIEAQAKNYVIHGDMNDHLLNLSLIAGGQNQTPRVFMPLTLELGSWSWVKKNPTQLFSIFGLFNPMLDHRYHRVMRRHVSLFHFLLRALANLETA